MTERRLAVDRRQSDRRGSRRLSLAHRVRFLRAAAPAVVLQGHLQDVSTSGVRLLLEQAVPQGEKLLIEVRDDDRTLCNVTVEVIWIEPADAGHTCVGCESLTGLTARQMKQLRSAALGHQSL